MQLIYISALEMDNNEIVCLSKSLGVLSDEEKERHVREVELTDSAPELLEALHELSNYHFESLGINDELMKSIRKARELVKKLKPSNQ